MSTEFDALLNGIDEEIEQQALEHEPEQEPEQQVAPEEKPKAKRKSKVVVEDAPVVTSEGNDEDDYISPATRAEMEAGRAALAKFATSAAAESGEAE